MSLQLPERDAPLRVGIVLAIAAAYFVAGALGLWLRIPPVHAAAMWPAAGIALACLLLWGTRYWIGVWLGALAVYLSQWSDMLAQDALRAIMLATTIATGTALQAALGAKLLNRLVEFPITLVRERDVLRFFAIGGPLTHVLGASWSTAMLLLAGVISTATAGLHWWTWWVGETIGTIIVAPLCLMWLSRDPVWTSRRVAVTAPLLITLVVAMMVFAQTGRSEREHLTQRIAEDGGELTNALAKHIDLDIETVHSVGALFTANTHIDAATFARFADSIAKRREDLQAIAWAPRIAHADRAAFERDTGRAIHERVDGQYAVAGVRDEYFPVQFAAPAAPNNAARGFDEASEPRRRQALQKALTLRSVAATEPVEIIQDGNSLTATLFLLPVFTTQEGPIEQTLRGYAIGAMQIPNLVDVALRDQPLAKLMHLRIDDVTDGATPRALFSALRASDELKTLDGELSHQATINLADRRWRVHLTPTHTYLATRHRPNAWPVLAGGLLASALIGIAALLVTGRAQSIELLVAKRTTELAQINEKLADEICDHLSTEHALEQERELLKTVINNLYEGIMVLDAGGDLRMANGVAFRMLRAITGEDLSTLPRPRKFRMYAPDGVTELLEEQTPHICALRGQTVSDFEMVVQAPGRPAMTLVVNAQPLVGNDQQRHGAILVMRDITDRKEVERLKSEFVATVSHELRTPITSIRGSLGLIAGGVSGPLAEKTRNLVEIALRNSDRLAHLINDLLDIEKMESGKMQFELLPHGMNALVEQAIEANSGYAHNLNVRFAFTPVNPDLMVKADSFRLLQVMNNLLSNAAKFSPAHSVVQVAVVSRVGANGARFARVLVTDHGPGIPEEFRSRIFQKFSQADSSDKRAKSGTGLGLAICKAIVEQMGGVIGYETQLGVGSTFYFELPQSGVSALANTGS